MEEEQIYIHDILKKGFVNTFLDGIYSNGFQKLFWNSVRGHLSLW